MQSIEEGKQYLRRNWKKGVVCPCCNKLVKLYKRRINSMMARGLVELYKLNKNNRAGYIHISEISKDNHYTIVVNFSLLKHWNLIREMPKDEESYKRKSGYWQITGYGIQFIFKKMTVAKYVFLSNQKVYGFTDDIQIDIGDCLRKKFNYNELMREYINIGFEQIGMDL